MKRVEFVGLDVHAETIAIAVAEPGGEVRSLEVIPNREDSVRKLVRKLGPLEELRFCYEAGPTGYALYWQLARIGAKFEVVAPTLVPVKAGDRMKTDRRDALKLARNYRAGELTPVWVPDAAHEALLREVEHTAARIMRLDGAIAEAVKCAPPKMRAVTEGLQALRGIAHVAAVTVVAELGELSRFARAKQLMGYGGIVASEDSSGERTRRGGITEGASTAGSC